MPASEPVNLKEKVRHLPDKPGVYLMKDAAGRVIYVGKAKSLRQRLASYFLKGSLQEKAGRIVEHTRRIVWEPGPCEFAALVRELHEELGIDVQQACLAPFVFASHAYDSFHLLMPLFLCRRWSGVVVRREHTALAWVKPERLSDYPMPPADAPLVAWLRDLL